MWFDASHPQPSNSLFCSCRIIWGNAFLILPILLSKWPLLQLSSVSGFGNCYFVEYSLSALSGFCFFFSFFYANNSQVWSFNDIPESSMFCLYFAIVSCLLLSDCSNYFCLSLSLAILSATWPILLMWLFTELYIWLFEILFPKFWFDFP